MIKIIAPFLLLILFSCQKRYELSSIEDFNVHTDANSYSVGDTVRFFFDGNPDNIVFWSGEDGHVYDYRLRTAVEGNSIVLNFRTFSQFGEPDVESLKLLISTDFAGIYDSAHVADATWTDITDRAILSTGQDQTSSGDINLNDFASLNKDMVLAFRYKTEVIKPATTQNRWVIRTFDLKSINAQGAESILASMSTAGWKAFSFLEPATAWSITPQQLISARSFTSLDDDWVITKSFNPNAVAPDKGQSVKNISQKVDTFTNVFSKPGTYKVVFVATNANVKKQQSIVREIIINIQ
jgi:plastocyanin